MCVKTSVIVCLNVCECVCEYKCEYTNVSVSVFECVRMRVSECVCELCGVCVIFLLYYMYLPEIKLL